MSQKLPKVLDEEEQERLLRRFNTRWQSPHRNLCMVRVMLEAGLRVSEVIKLKPEHVNLDTGKVTVREGKGKKDRIVWIGESLCILIQEWMERRPDSPWLFPTRNGDPVKPQYMWAMMKREARKAKIAEAGKVSPHTLRHTAATNLLRKTGNLLLVKNMLGHASLDTTMIYTHLTNEDLKEAMRGG